MTVARVAAEEGVGEAVGRRQIGRAGKGARQIIEGAVRIVVEGAVGVDGEQRAGWQRDLRADIAGVTVDGRDIEVGAAVDPVTIVVEQVFAELLACGFPRWRRRRPARRWR